MTKEPSKLDARYQDAQARSKKAEQEIRRLSRDRLAELMKLPVRQQFAHLEDAALTAEDRTTLRRSVTATLPARKVRFRGRQRAIAWFRLRARLSVVITIAMTVGPLGVWAAMTWLNTGQIYQFSGPLRVMWHYPSGEVRPGVIPAGVPVVLVQHMGIESYLRRWVSGQGYATAKLPPVELND